MAKKTHEVSIKTKSYSSRITNDPKRADQLTKMGEQLTAEAAKISKNALKLTKDVTKMKPGVFIKSSNLTDKQAQDMAKHMTLNAFRFVEHLQQWIERNSQPRKWVNLSKWFVKREPTRWAKRGPMTRKDWVRFYNWAAKNAAPKVVSMPKKKPDGKEKQKEPLDPSVMEEVMEHVKKLAMPRKPRVKYVYPDEPDYPYSPKIEYKKPAKKDKGRPFEPPEVPEVFQHIDLETDFWSQLRFPLRPSVTKYKPSENVLKLAQPRITPPNPPHCPIPEKPVEYVPPRRRMTRRQWQEHLRRIEYLAKPVYRPVVDIYYE